MSVKNWPNRKAILWGKTIRCFVGLFLSLKFFGNSHGVIQCTPVDITFISTSFLLYFVDFEKMKGKVYDFIHFQL